MTVINCPECNDKMSDTLNKCPHCGFVIKKEKNIKEKKSFKELVNSLIGWIKNNKKKSLIIGGSVLVVFVLIYGVMYYKSLEARRVADEAVIYLENEGFDCDLVDSYESYNEVREEKAYICKKTDITVEHEYLILFGDDNTMMYRLNNFDDTFEVRYTYKEFEVTFDIWDFDFVADDKDVRLHSEGFESKYLLPVTGGLKNGVYVDNVCSEGYSDSVQKRCELARAYKNEVNESIKMFIDLYDEIDMELK